MPGEEPVEGLERDAGFLHQLLGGEAVAAFGDQPTGGVDDGLRLLHLPGARALHRGRPVGGALRPGQRRCGGAAHEGDNTTTGITRSVRVW